jgi:hypothetical protein
MYVILWTIERWMMTDDSTDMESEEDYIFIQEASKERPKGWMERRDQMLQRLTEGGFTAEEKSELLLTVIKHDYYIKLADPEHSLIDWREVVIGPIKEDKDPRERDENGEYQNDIDKLNHMLKKVANDIHRLHIFPFEEKVLSFSAWRPEQAECEKAYTLLHEAENFIDIINHGTMKGRRMIIEQLCKAISAFMTYVDLSHDVDDQTKMLLDKMWDSKAKEPEIND